MKRISVFLVLTGLIAISFIPVLAQENQFSDNFDYTEVNTDVYKPDANNSHVISIDNNTLKVTVNKVALWDGFAVDFIESLDLSEFPYASMKIKTNTDIDFRIYLMDDNGLYSQSDITHTIAASDEFHTYYFDWHGRFWHGAWDDAPEDYLQLDSTKIDQFLINVMPGVSGDFGTLWIDDLKVGSVAEIQLFSSDKDILSTTIGVVSGTIIKNVTEGTTAGQLFAALTLSDFASAKILKTSGGSKASNSSLVTEEFVVEVTAEDGTKTEYSIQLFVMPENALEIEKLPGDIDNPVFLDVENGQIDEIWSNYNAVELPNVIEDANGNEVTFGGASDLSATFKAVWNEYSLYVLIEITDDVLKNNSTEIYLDDAAEIFLDMTNKKNDVTTGFGADDYQLGFGFEDTDASVIIGGGSTGHVYGWEQGLRDGGYWIEIEFDIEALFAPSGLTAEVGRVIGLDIQLDDDDGNYEIDGNGTDREHTLMWNSDANENWHDPSRFGTAILSGIKTSVTDFDKVNNLRLYPNPAHNQLKISNVATIDAIEVYSATGQKMTTINSINENTVSLNIGSFQKGIYFIKVAQTDGYVSTVKFVKE